MTSDSNRLLIHCIWSRGKFIGSLINNTSHEEQQRQQQKKAVIISSATHKLETSGSIRRWLSEWFWMNEMKWVNQKNPANEKLSRESVCSLEVR